MDRDEVRDRRIGKGDDSVHDLRPHKGRCQERAGF